MFGYDKEGASTSTDTYGTICLDVSHMKEGDVAGLCVFQDPHAYVAVKMIDGKKRVVYYRAPWWEPKADWQGVVDDKEHYRKFSTSTASHNDKIYLRAVANFKTNKLKFYISWDNQKWYDLARTSKPRCAIPSRYSQAIALPSLIMQPSRMEAMWMWIGSRQKRLLMKINSTI